MDNSTQHHDERLVRYLDNDMDLVERKEMDDILASDASMRARLDDLMLAKETVRQYGLRSKVAGIHGEMMQEFRIPVRTISSAKRVIRYSLSVAAGILLLVGAFMAYNFFSLSSENVYSGMYQAYEISTVRGNTAEKAVILEYRQKNYKEVVRLHKSGADSSVAAGFLAAMSNMELNNLTDAIAGLEEIVKSQDNPGASTFLEEAEYYLLLAYIRNRDYDLAIPIMEKIKNDPDHLYNDKVDRKDIRKVKMLKWR